MLFSKRVWHNYGLFHQKREITGAKMAKFENLYLLLLQLLEIYTKTWIFLLRNWCDKQSTRLKDCTHTDWRKTISQERKHTISYQAEVRIRFPSCRSSFRVAGINCPASQSFNSILINMEKCGDKPQDIQEPELRTNGILVTFLKLARSVGRFHIVFHYKQKQN